MGREIPACPPSKPETVRAKSIVLDFELITPLVGGGASSGQLDLEFPVRPTAIRGHLRGWWRLIHGFASGEEMWQREEELFGSTELPSPFAISVRRKGKPEMLDPSKRDQLDPFGPVAYALFASIENEQLVAREGLQFQLTIQMCKEAEFLRRRDTKKSLQAKSKQHSPDRSFQSLVDELHEAVAAWSAFGGIGGRTRRGCGAIQCLTQLPIKFGIPGRLFVGGSHSDAIEAWKETLEAYREFRQTPRGKRHGKVLPNGKSIQVPGRSHWPEADSIRKITGCSLKPTRNSSPVTVPIDEDPRDHSKPLIPDAQLPSFPKAVLGLPINFHFADGPNKGKAVANLDPKDVQLYPLVRSGSGEVERKERMASPVITRPYFVNGSWHSGILILKNPNPNFAGVRVQGSNASLSGDLSRDLPRQQIVDESLSSVRPMRGKSNAIDALIDFLDSRNFKEVRP